MELYKGRLPRLKSGAVLVFAAPLKEESPREARGISAQRIVKVRQMICRDVVNKRAVYLVVANAAMEPTEKHNELHGASRVTCDPVIAFVLTSCGKRASESRRHRAQPLCMAGTAGDLRFCDGARGHCRRGDACGLVPAGD